MGSEMHACGAWDPAHGPAKIYYFELTAPERPDIRGTWTKLQGKDERLGGLSLELALLDVPKCD